MKTGRPSRTALPEIPSPAWASPLPAIGPRPGRRPVSRIVGPVQAAALRVEDVDPGSVGAEDPGRLVDRALEDLLRVPQADDPAADLPERALRLGSALHVRPRPAQLLDEVGVGHRRGGVIGQGPDEGDLLVAERVGPAGEGAHRAERPAAADERRDEERMDRQVLDEAIGVREVDERGVGRVVAGDHDLAEGDGPTEHPDPEIDPERSHPGPTAIVGDPGVGGEAEDAGRLVEEVGHRAIGSEEAGGLVDGAVEDRRWLARTAAQARRPAPGAAARLAGGPSPALPRLGPSWPMYSACERRSRACPRPSSFFPFFPFVPFAAVSGPASSVPSSTGAWSMGSSAARVTAAAERRDRVVATGGGYPSVLGGVLAGWTFRRSPRATAN